MKEIHDRLAVWAKLYKECERLKLLLDSGEPRADARAIESQYRAVKARTEAAFKDASAAIERLERAARPIDGTVGYAAVQLSG